MSSNLEVLKDGNFDSITIFLNTNVYNVFTRITLLLQHDQPLTKHLLMSSSTGRYHPVLCKKAASKVSELIKNSSEFCLLESHSYISFIKDEQGHPTSFYVIKVTSKPPCLVVWVAFLGGIPGSERHTIVSDLVRKLEELTMKQRVTWRDIPIYKIKYSSETSPLDIDRKPSSRSHVTSGSYFPDVFSCNLLNKPVEKILVRYENVPSDYRSLLGSLHTRTQGSSTAQKMENEQSKNASAAFLTLSRYLNHQRWIYSLQNTPSVAISPTAVSRILQTVCKARIQEGFTFAHSAKGVQNMVLEVPMCADGESSRDLVPQSCVIQYIIFPPHTTTTSSGESISEEEFPLGSVKDDASNDADGEVQIVLEVWTEPQDGIISQHQHNKYLAGKQSREISTTMFSKDLECISTLVTFEHLVMMCQNPCITSPLTDTFSISHIYTNQNAFLPEKSLPSVGASIHEVPFAFDLLNLLPKADQTEMIFSLFIQNLIGVVPENSFSLFNSLKSTADRPNAMLFESFIKELTEVSDRELSLSCNDCKALPEIIRKRHTSNFHLQPNHNASGRRSMHSTSVSSHQPQRTEYNSRRFPSGNSVTSSLADTHRDSHSQHDFSNSEYVCGDPKWKCFLKAISPTHMVLTLVPASFEDLRILTISPDVLEGSNSDIVDVIKEPLPTSNTELIGNLDDISINSSIPNLETVPKEPMELRSPRLENLQGMSRQRSGSDVFEMNRPKIVPMRKLSGDPGPMRDRTASLDGLSQFRAKALLKKKLKEARDRDMTDSIEQKLSSPIAEENTRRRHRPLSKDEVPAVESLQCSSPIISLNTRQVVGSLSIPIYVYDCSFLGLTNSVIYKERVEPPRNHHLNFLFKPEIRSEKEVSDDPRFSTQKTPEPEGPTSNEFTDHSCHIDKDVKQWYHVIKMIYFKSFVSVLFRSLQLKLPIHSYDIKHAVDYCDNDTTYDLELETYVKAVCPHLYLQKENPEVLDINAVKSAVSCFKQDSWHKSVQKKFLEIVGSKFRSVPGLEDIFFFCPPGLDFGELVRMSSRRRDETKSSGSNSKHLNSYRPKGEEEDDKTIEFRSNVSNQSLKFNKSQTETEIETAQRDFHSSLSFVSQSEEEWDSDDDEIDRDSDEFSPPLFIQFSFSISQENQDIISVPVSYLPSCMCEIFQDKNLPDPEQDILVGALGLRIDIVCMTLPQSVRNITENVGTLRSTSLCSTSSFRNSRSAPEEDLADIHDLIGDDIGSEDILSHLPAYQHKAVMDIKDELNWMLMDEIGFALSKSSPLTYQTLDFICKHVQASTRDRPGSMMEAVELEFVFGKETSLGKFKELFGKINVQGFVLKQEKEFYYLGKNFLASNK